MIQFPIHSPRAHEKAIRLRPDAKRKKCARFVRRGGNEDTAHSVLFEKNQVSEILRLLKQWPARHGPPGAYPNRYGILVSKHFGGRRN